MRRERLYLADIVAAADAIAEFSRGHNVGSFQASLLLRSAVAHQLTIIGEAVAHLLAELRARYPNIPWSDIKAFRNIVVHNYFGVDWDETWRSATVSVPLLRTQVDEILRLEFPE